MKSKLIVRAAVCGRHFHDDCTGCASAKDWANSEMDELRDRIATLEAELEKLRPQVKVADDKWDAKCDELAAMKARGDRLAGALSKGGFMMTETHRLEGYTGARKLIIGFEDGEHADDAMAAIRQALTEWMDQHHGGNDAENRS